MAAQEMYDYLSDMTADYNYTLSVKPYTVMPFISKKAQIIHKKDDGSIRAYAISTGSKFEIQLDYSGVTQDDHGTIFDLWNDPVKANGSQNTFYFAHPLDGHTYVVRFLSDLESEYRQQLGTRRIPIKPISLYVEGRKAEA